MNITDLADTDVRFECLYANKESEYWDYNFYAKAHGDYEYMQSMSKSEIKQLRENCKKILLITSNVVGEN